MSSDSSNSSINSAAQSSNSNVSSTLKQEKLVKLSGRKVVKDPIIPTSWKVGLVVSGLILAGLLAITISMAKGAIPVSTHSWVFKTFAGATGVFGTLHLITDTGFICYYYSEKKNRKAIEDKRIATKISNDLD